MKTLEFLAIASLAVVAAQAKEVGVFQPPSLDGYTLFETKLVDKSGPEDGLKETTLLIYRKDSNSYIGQYVTHGRLWAVSVMNNLDNKSDSVSNYLLIDSQCRGVFDEKHGMAVFYLPTCVLSASRR